MNINKNKIISLFLGGASLVFPFGSCIAAQQNSIKEFDIKQSSSVISKLDDKSINKQEIYNGKKGSGIIKKIILVTFGIVIAIFSIPIIFTVHQRRLDFLPEIVKNSLRLYNFNPENEVMRNIEQVSAKFKRDYKDFFKNVKEKNLIFRIPISDKYLNKYLIIPISTLTVSIDYIEEILKFGLFKIKETTY